MPIQVVGRVHRRQEGKRPLLGVAVGLVVDVVEDQSVDVEGRQALDREVGDLLGPLRGGRQPWRSQGEEQELTLEGDDAMREVHAVKLGNSDPRMTRDGLPFRLGLGP